MSNFYIAARVAPDTATAHLRSIDISVFHPRSAIRLPEELLVTILRHLCHIRPWRYDRVSKKLVFDSSWARCALACHHWAAHIRPANFSHVDLTSEKSARMFSALVRSSVGVLTPLCEIVVDITIYMDDIARPWLYFVWALLRDGVLPNLVQVDLTIKGAVGDSDESRVPRIKGEFLLDPGLPRTPPSAHPIPLCNLRLEDLRFRSHKTLLRSLVSHSPITVACSNIRWPEESAVLEPAGRLYSQLSPRGLSLIEVSECTAVVPVFWTLLTTHRPGVGATPRRLYITEAQMDHVMDILRLFSDECKCRECESVGRNWWYAIQVYPGA